MKKCNKCGEVKENNYFSVQKRKRKLQSGEIKLYIWLQSNCNECRRLPRDESKVNPKSDIRILDTMIEIYKEKGFNNITDAFKSIGKKELKELAYKRLGK